MADNYDITIRSEKLTQEIAAEIFNYISERCLVHYYKYLGYNDEMNCYVRGYIDLREILTEYGFDETDFTEIMDESNRNHRGPITIIHGNGEPLPADDPMVIKYQEIADEIEAEVSAGKFTIWNVGREMDEFIKQLREGHKNSPSDDTITQFVSSFGF